MLPPALADKAARMRSQGRSIKAIAGELGVSDYAVKMATTPGFADRTKERRRRSDAARAAERANSVEYRTYQREYYQTTKALRIGEADDLAAKLMAWRKQTGRDQKSGAGEFGVTLTTYQTWEAARCPRSQIKLVSLALKAIASTRSASGRDR